MRYVPAIHTTGLGKRFGSNWALQDCGVSVPRGHVTALVGPNGVGNTTLLKLLAGCVSRVRVRPRCLVGYPTERGVLSEHRIPGPRCAPLQAAERRRSPGGRRASL